MPLKDPVARLIYFREYREKNKEHLREIARVNAAKRYKLNPDKHRKHSNAWKEKNKETSKEKRIEKKRKYIDFLNEIKTDSGCVKCGYKENPAKLHMHHKEPASKAFDVSHGWHYTMAAAVAEIAKCEVLCVSCHAIETKCWENKKCG